MVTVRMLTHMTGGRYDGRQWPAHMGLIEVPEWEARHLVNGGNAEYPDAPQLARGYDVLRVASPDYEQHLKPAGGGIVQDGAGDHGDSVPLPLDNSTVVPDVDSDFDRDDSGNDFDREEEAPVLKQPYGNAAKAEWVAYVVARGITSREKAEKMTKAALMALNFDS